MLSISLEHSPLYLLIGLPLALLVAYLIYTRPYNWDLKLNRALAVIRFVLVFSLVLLLLSPLINQLATWIQKPIVVIGVDNSESVGAGMPEAAREDLMNNLVQLRETLLAKDYDVHLKSLAGSPQEFQDIAFDQKSTNLNKFLKEVQSEYEGANLSEVYLISDGNYNQGSSPAYFPFPFKVNTLGVGDTTSKDDLVLQQVLYNKIAYQGNLFPVFAEVVNYGFSGKKSVVEVYKSGILLDKEAVNFQGESGLKRVALEVPADQSGYNRLEVRIAPLEGEEVVVNNAKTIFVDVVDGKQKILMAGPAPHPDMKAFAAVIEKNQNYELVRHIPGVNEFKQDKYDLAIVHESYDRLNRLNGIMKYLKAQGVPILHVIGTVSHLNRANREEMHLNVLQRRNQRDAVVGALNESFSKFTLTEIDNQTMAAFPPVSVPFGEYQVPPTADVLLYQRVGKVVTNRPLIYMVEENSTKSAFIFGDNYWKWRMQEFALTDETESFDNLFLKLFQFMSTKVDKRKFRFYPIQNEFLSNETVKFQSEMYNEIFERIYGNEISITISNSEGTIRELSHAPVSAYDQLELGGLDEGAYQYQATVDLNGKKQYERGEFIVKELLLENADQVANFDLLRRLSNNTAAQFYTLDDWPQLQEKAIATDFKNIIHGSEDVLPLINLKWLFFLLLLLASLEWFTRKYNGAY